MMLKRRRMLAAAIAGGLLTAGAAGTYLAAQAKEPREKVIKIRAKRFDYTPNVVTLKKGVPVTLELTTADVVMGFNVPDLGVRADIIPGKVSRVHVVPQKTGSFVFVCDIFCGIGHERMDGKIVVVD